MTNKHRGFGLIEIVIVLALWGALLPVLGRITHQVMLAVSEIRTDIYAMREWQYIQMVLREDMATVDTVTQQSTGVRLLGDTGEIVYLIEAGILKRRAAGQTIRLNPDRHVECTGFSVAEAPRLVLYTTGGEQVFR